MGGGKSSIHMVLLYDLLLTINVAGTWLYGIGSTTVSTLHRAIKSLTSALSCPTGAIFAKPPGSLAGGDLASI
jgi:hypothetical protein